MKIVLAAASAVNLPKVVCSFVLGDNHKPAHRMGVGMGVMLSGVYIAHSAAAFGHYVGLLIDALGYSIHGLGLVPFLECLAEVVKKAENESESEVAIHRK